MKLVWLLSDRLGGLYVIAVLLWWRWQGQVDSALAAALVVASVVLTALLSMYGLQFARAFSSALPAPRPDSPQADYDDGPQGAGQDRSTHC
jgi:hypothetical protein